MLKKIKKETVLVYLPFVFLFLYLLFTNQSVSLMADDFRYSMRSCFNWVLPQERITNFFHIIETAYYDYMVDCARYGTAMLIYTVLLFGSSLFKIINPLIFTMIGIVISYLILGRFPRYKKDIIVTLSTICLFYLMPTILLDEDVYWITGTITYGWSILYFILFLLPFLPEFKDKLIFKKPIVIIFYFIISFMAGSAVENYSITFSCIILFLILYNVFYLKDKAYFKGIRLMSVPLFIFNIIEFLSPGTTNRVNTFEIGFIKKTFQGFFAFAQYQYVLSGFLILLFLLILLVFIYKHNKKLFIASLVVFAPLLLLHLVINFKSFNYITNIEPLAYFMMPLDYFEWHKRIMFDWLWIVMAYYILITLIIIIDVIYLSIKNNNITYFVLNLMSCFPLLAQVGSGAGSTRIAFMAILFLGINSIYIMCHYIKQYRPLFSLILILGLYGLLFQHAYIIDNVKVGIERNNIFYSITDETTGDIVLPKYRYSMHGNFVDEDTWEFQEAEIYFGIKPRASFKFEE